MPSGALFGWELERAGRTITVDVDGPLTLDDSELMVAAALRAPGSPGQRVERGAPARRRPAGSACSRLVAAVPRPVPLLSRRPPSLGGPARVRRARPQEAASPVRAGPPPRRRPIADRPAGAADRRRSERVDDSGELRPLGEVRVEPGQGERDAAAHPHVDCQVDDAPQIHREPARICQSSDQNASTAEASRSRSASRP